MNTLFSVNEFDGIFLDALVLDQQFNLLFGSFYGRDSILQQFFASFSIPVSQGGLDQFNAFSSQKTKHRVDMRHIDKLKKLVGSVEGTMFGKLNHVWLYDERLATPDFANKTAWLVMQDEADLEDKVWKTICQLSSIPLLNHWKEAFFKEFAGEFDQCYSCLIRPRFQLHQVMIPGDEFERRVTQLVQTDQFVLDV